MIFDLQTLQLIWWALVGVVLILYATTAGFDFGVTLLMPFLKRKAKFAENDAERRVILNTIAPTWDGNQTWLVFAGGALFVIWPSVYAATFSGMYFLMMMILWSFFLRPTGFDYRGKLPSHTWRSTWDWALFLSALLPVFSFGLIIGNLFIGLPIAYDPILMRSFYFGSFFGLFHVFPVVCGLAALAMCLMHGTAHLNRRTDGSLKIYFQRLNTQFIWIFLLLVTVAGFMLTRIPGYVLAGMSAHPLAEPFNNITLVIPGGWWMVLKTHYWKWIPVVGVYLFALLTLYTQKKNASLSFWMSALAVASTVTLFGVGLFPFVLPSSVNPQQSLTLWSASSAQFTLMGMFYFAVVLLVIIVAYKFWGYHALWGKKATLSTKDVEKQDHTFY